MLFYSYGHTLELNAYYSRHALYRLTNQHKRRKCDHYHRSGIHPPTFPTIPTIQLLATALNASICCVSLLSSALLRSSSP